MNLNGASNPNPSIVLRDQKFSQNPPQCSSLYSSLSSLWSPPLITTSQSCVTIFSRVSHHHQTSPDRPQNLDRSSSSAMPCLSLDTSSAPSSVSRSSLNLLPEMPLQSSEEKALILDCSICFSQFNNVFRCPKLLQCHHTFCLECLARMNMKSSDPTTIQCPLCRQYTPLPAQGLPKLATNHKVLSCLPAAMQRVDSIHFIRNEGKLQVKRSMDDQQQWRESSLSLTLTSHTLDAGPSELNGKFWINILLLQIVGLAMTTLMILAIVVSFRNEK